MFALNSSASNAVGTDFAAGWTEVPVRIGPANRIALLHAAIAQQPGDARLHLWLGRHLLDAKRHAEALETFRRARTLDPNLAAALMGAAACLRKLGRQIEVLALCKDDWGSCEAARHYEKGRALIRLGHIAEGKAELRCAVQLEFPDTAALRALLEALCRIGAAEEMLDLCDELDPDQQSLALVRGHRAVALSMLGKVEAARAFVDLERCALRYRFVPPASLGSIQQFNRRLADAILADAPLAPAMPDADINYRPQLRADAEIRALRDFIRESIRDYILQTEAVRTAAGMQQIPRAATLGFGTVVLRHKRHNGQHLHPIGYLSSVYHVHVPPAAGGDPHGGALVLGPCDMAANGHRACWGERHILAEAGWLTIFPSHVFHDVVPTLSPEPRISVIGDLNPDLGRRWSRAAV